MSNVEGKILVRLTVKDGAVTPKIQSARPLLACRVFEGKTIEQALPLVPMLYSLCGMAQSVAAVRAIESSLGKTASTIVEQQRELIIRLESLREHLWRLSIDWPSLTSSPNATQTFAPLNLAITQLTQALNSDKQLNAQPGMKQCNTHLEHSKQWEAISRQVRQNYLAEENAPTVLHQTAESLISSPIAHQELPELPEISNADYGQLLRGPDADTVISRPQWQSACFETGPLARQKDHANLQHIKKTHESGLYTRYMARVFELEQLLQQLDSDFSGDIIASPMTASDGIAQVEAVRGRLVHCVDLDDDTISRYRILAPTEWNFHPQGIAAKMLADLKPESREQLEQDARMIIHAIDPCVGYELTIEGLA